MEEKRKRPRWRTSFFFRNGREYSRKYFNVIDRKTGESIGHLVDLTPEGLRILSKSPIDRGAEFDLNIELPTAIKSQPNIAAKARCVWCEQDINPDFFNAGFEILSISPPYVEIIEILIQE